MCYMRSNHLLITHIFIESKEESTNVYQILKVVLSGNFSHQKIGLLLLLNKIDVLDAKRHNFPEKSKNRFFEDSLKIKFFSNRDIEYIWKA